MPFKNKKEKLANNARWRAENRGKEKEYARRGKLKRTYGITEEEYDEILQRQLGNCGVCRRHASAFARRLAVDHDHHTGAIRGLLCNSCNRYVIGRLRAGLGAVELLANASEYLKPENYTRWVVPAKRPKPRKKK